MKKPEDMTTAELGLLFPVKLVAPNSNWPEIFQCEKRTILRHLAGIPVTYVEHIGSTAVAGLQSKDVIDMLLETAEKTDLSLLKKKMKALDYHCLKRPDNPDPHMMFVKGYTAHGFRGQTFHVHVRYPAKHAELVFRDLLKSDNSIAAEYEQLKMKLAQEFPNDREAYTIGKTDFIKKCMTDCS